MADYDLTGKLKKEFTFSIDGQEYVFHKPTVRDMRSLAKKFNAINKELDPDAQVDLTDEALTELFKYIDSIGESRPIAEVMDEQTVDVQNLFNDMILKELGTK
jgi:hypothetical protein